MLSNSPRIPPIFVSHGPAPSDRDRIAPELAQWGRDLPRPHGILVISSGWQEELPTRGSTAPPRLLGETGGISYDAPSAPDLAYELHGLMPIERASDRGWDYGVFGPLRHLFPAADIPVLQLSLVTGAVPRRLFGIGRKIGVLAARGILLMGSGGITWSDNERASDPNASPTEWAREFDAWVANLLADAELEDLLQWRARGPNARRAQASSRYLDPLFVVAGAASLYDHAVGFPIRGFDHGCLSRRCIQFGR